ncbi:MAG: NAD(P)-dependent oxidoreductase [Rhodocyclales bacterium]|nr:NAD(P)-dependent oxidoreductase [Rhodocyclales bacterium]
MATIAFLGTGLLGAAFAEAAARRGDRVTVWNRSADKARALEGLGVTVAESPAAAVRGAGRVHLVLKDDAVVDAVTAAARTGLAAGAVICDHSTTLPALTTERAERCAREGINYLHCPVFMTPLAARAGSGSMLVSGPRKVFDTVAAELAAMTGRLEYQGERADLAAAKKLFGNALILSLSATLADMLTLAQASDVAAQAVIDVAALFDLNALVATRGGNMVKGNFAPSFELAMARKDFSLMLATAGERPLAVLPGVAARMDQLIAAGHGADDVSIWAQHALTR